MSTVKGQIAGNDLAKVPVSHSAKRKAAQDLLEASFEGTATSRNQAQAGSAAAVLTPEASEPPAKRRRTESELPFQQRDSTLKAGTCSAWREVCQSFTACNLSLLSTPDARNPQQLLLTQKGVTVVLVDRPAQAASAAALLRASMQDPLLGLDLEWQADTTPTSQNPVSLVQIASATCCLLVRTCSLKFKLPPEILELLRDSSVHLIGMGWAGSDEGKFQRTFGCGRGDFGRFTDLQEVGALMGYHQLGITSFTELLLNMTISKSKRISRSNWAASSLTAQQVKYAALDALLTGMLFRALEDMHFAGKECEACQMVLGIRLPAPDLACSCGKIFRQLADLRAHAAATSHACNAAKCYTCGRLVCKRKH